MHAMNAWKDEARVQHFACLALSNFAHDDSNKVAIGILGNSAISIIFGDWMVFLKAASLHFYMWQICWCLFLFEKFDHCRCWSCWWPNMNGPLASSSPELEIMPSWNNGNFYLQDVLVATGWSSHLCRSTRTMQGFKNRLAELLPIWGFTNRIWCPGSMMPRDDHDFIHNFPTDFIFQSVCNIFFQFEPANPIIVQKLPLPDSRSPQQKSIQNFPDHKSSRWRLLSWVVLNWSLHPWSDFLLSLVSRRSSYVQHTNRFIDRNRNRGFLLIPLPGATQPAGMCEWYGPWY